MPIAVVHLLKGRTGEQRALLIRNVTKAITESLDVKPEQVRVILQEQDAENWGVGGLPISRRDQ